MFLDDDGNELLLYKTGIYHNDTITQFIQDAEKAIGVLIYDRRYFRQGMPEKSVAIRIEALTPVEVEILRELELEIAHKAIPEPINLRW